MVANFFQDDPIEPDEDFAAGRIGRRPIPSSG